MDCLKPIPDRDLIHAHRAESVKIRIHRMKFQSLIGITKTDYDVFALCIGDYIAIIHTRFDQ
jgi:hypothetical protein